ncbi:MAG: hypothetical protein FWE59_03520 [Oscillospiraceae bacterium]|nr:hypothetical protein [Oscillospiraceae bacterium]
MPLVFSGLPAVCQRVANGLPAGSLSGYQRVTVDLAIDFVIDFSPGN